MPLKEEAISAKPALATAFRATRKLAQAFFQEKATRWRAIYMSVALACTLLAESGIVVYYSEVQRGFMTALQEKNADGFYGGLLRTGVVIAVVIPIIALKSFTALMFRVEWRRAMTLRFAHWYLSGSEHSAFYQFSLTGEIDNPDQRICQDVMNSVGSILSLVENTMGSAMRIMGFAAVLYRVSPLVCAGVILYSLAGILVTTTLFGPWITKYQNLLLKQEAGLRYSLIRVRENSESIAFFGGGDAELAHFGNLFAVLLATAYRSIVINTGFSAFNRTFHWATFAVAPLLVGPAYLRGEVEFGTISQTNMAFATILDGLTLLMNSFEEISGLAVHAQRLCDLEERLQQERRKAQLARLSGVGYITSFELPAGTGAALQLRDVTLQTPEREGCPQRTLAVHVSLQVSHNQSLLITGDSGIGKSSLLRGIAGLWRQGAGSVELCSKALVFFMPQKPYMFLGSLGEQLLYPQLDQTMIGAEALEQALREVGLGYLLGQHSLQETKEWASILSLGEQQRINFARLVIRPGVRLALIDEGTSACDPGNEARLYELLQQRVSSFVSVGHRPALEQLHTHALWMQRPNSSANQAAPADVSLLPMAEYKRRRAEMGNLAS